jgi:tetratricopeptide (TPR) repeat protein
MLNSIRILCFFVLFNECFKLYAIEDSVDFKLKKILKTEEKINFLISSSTEYSQTKDSLNAFKHGKYAIEISKNTNSDLLLAKTYYNLGDIYASFQKYKLAQPCFEKSQLYAEKSKDFDLIIKNLIKKSINCRHTEHGYLKSIDFLIEAKKMAFENNSSAYYPTIFKNLAHNYVKVSDYQLGMFYLMSYSKLIKSTDIPSQIEVTKLMSEINKELGNYRVAIANEYKILILRKQIKASNFELYYSHKGIGLIHQFSKNYDEALKQYQISIKYLELSKNTCHCEYPKEFSDILRKIAFLYNDWDQPKIALKYIERSYNLAIKSIDQNNLAYTELRYAQIYTKLKKYNQAEIKFKKALELTSKLGMRATELETIKDMSYLYEKMNNYSLALAYQRKYNFLKDSNNKLNEVRLDVHLNSLYNLDKKEIENKYLTEKLELERADLQKSYILVATIVFILLILVIFLFYLQKNNRKNKFYNRLLNQQKKEIEKQNNSLNALVRDLDSLVHARTLQLEKQNEQLKQYAFDNAHVLRAPVASIMGLINLLKNNENYKNDEIIFRLDKSSNKLDEAVRTIKLKLED